MSESRAHWETIYSTKQPDTVSWYQPHLELSLELIQQLNLNLDAPIIDIGGGASTLVDDLLASGFSNITVLDISQNALEVSQSRLGPRASSIKWIAGDITTFDLPRERFSLWHDRAVFHFLTKKEDQEKYAERLKNALQVNGFALISTFGPNGPMKCSGLDIVRYSPETLHQALGENFHLVSSRIENHLTPMNKVQEFVYCLFKKVR